MAELHVMDALREKRSELSGVVSRLEQQLAQHRGSLAHLDATMRLFDPDLVSQDADLNRECGADFDPAMFEHRAVWNAIEGRVEMHLASQTDQVVVLGGRRIVFAAGETIHTENSYKYHPEQLDGLATRAGWELAERWLYRLTAPNGKEWVFGTTMMHA